MNPHDADNWIVWGLILRTAGNYSSALHKFEQSLKLDPGNETAKFEMDILKKIMELDSQISLDQVQSLKNMRALENGETLSQSNKKGVCSVLMTSVLPEGCNIF